MRILFLLIKMIVLLLIGLLAAAFLSRRALPPHDTVLPSTHFKDTQGTQLGQAVAPLIEAHPGLSGIHPLTDGHDAFAARAMLARMAERSIDAQYYIWHNDTSGRLLLQSLRQAADRGVRVRLLLDDNNTSGMDGLLLGLDAHPNIEVRLFNPIMQRQFRPLAFLSDFSRANRRMHNKSFTVDNQATVVGGRNVGNEYFGAGDGVMFADLDVVAIGDVVDKVSEDFDRYWASGSVYAASQIIDANVQKIDIGTTPSQDPSTQNYLKVLEQSLLERKLSERSLSFEWAPTHLLSDDPAKGLGKAGHHQMLLGQLDQRMKKAREHLVFVSPYFVPTETGATLLTQLAQRGVTVAVLTNALAATDVAVVHAGYAKYRKQLLKAGVQLFELKPDATVIPKVAGGLTGSSGASLHAKTFEVDGEQFFVGSFNMDPRSAALNTEMGILVDSPVLADGLLKLLTTHRDSSYRVGLDGENLTWTTLENGKEIIYHEEPNTTWLRRTSVRLMALLPIEWLL